MGGQGGRPPVLGGGGSGNGGGSEPRGGSGGMAGSQGGQIGGVPGGGRGGVPGGGGGGVPGGGRGSVPGGGRGGSAGVVNESGASGDGNAGMGGQGGGSGAEPGGAGSGGESAPDCDDGNPCTDDRRTAGGVCVYTERTCDDPGPCATSGCDPATGACVVLPLEDGLACDDGNACTEEDRCTAGVCEGSATDVVVSDTKSSAIPDGSWDPRRDRCERSGKALEIALPVSAPGSVASVEVDLDFEHTYVTELDVRLRHEASGREAVLFHFEDEPAYDEDADADGVYTFTDSTQVPFGPPQGDDDIEPGAYAPREPLAIFAGAPVAGTWRLVAVDTCEGDRGRIRGVTLRIRRSCE